MSQWNDPGKVEEAMVAVASSLSLSIYSGDNPGTSVTFTTGQDSDTLAIPAVVCALVGSSGPEVVKGTGIHRANAVVRVISSANVLISEHRERAAAVFDVFLSSTIKDTLSAAVSDFHVYEFNYQSPEPTRKEPIEGQENAFVFVTELPVEIVWCGSAIA